MSLEYEPTSEPLHISAQHLFLDSDPIEGEVEVCVEALEGRLAIVSPPGGCWVNPRSLSPPKALKCRPSVIRKMLVGTRG